MSILNYWAQEFEDKLADLIYTQFSKVNGGTPNKKRQRYVAGARSRKHLCTKAIPSLHLTYNKKGENMGLVLNGIISA